MSFQHASDRRVSLPLTADAEVLLDTLAEALRACTLRLASDLAYTATKGRSSEIESAHVKAATRLLLGTIQDGILDGVLTRDAAKIVQEEIDDLRRRIA